MKILKFCFKILFLLTLGFFTSCDEDDKDVVISKVDEIQFLSGNERAKLIFQLEESSNAKEIVIFWNSLEDERIIPVNPSVSEYEILFENLPEGDFEFNIYARDEAGNKSQLETVYGHIYGSKYQASLSERLFVEAEVTEEVCTIQWQASPEGAVEFEMMYSDKDDVEQSITFEAKKNITILENVKSGSVIKHRLKYNPEEGAIDVFYSEWVEQVVGLVPMEEFLLDKSIIVEHHLTNDKAGQHYNGSIAKLFDNIINVDNYYSSAGGEQPLTFTFDLGQSVVLSKFTITGRIAIPDRIPKEFDIWATNDITDADTETPTSDFVAWETESISKGWTKVGENPGNLVAPDPDPDWNNPPIRDFLIKEDRDSKYRFIRIRIKSTWQEGKDVSSQEVNIGEIDVLGKRLP